MQNAVHFVLLASCPPSGEDKKKSHRGEIKELFRRLGPTFVNGS